LANAGVALETSTAAATSPISLGIVLGLVLGKPIGIFCASWFAVRLGLALLPAQVGWRQILGVGAIGGIGFTMSIFIASLAFAGQPLLEIAKLGIFAGSLVAGGTGFLLLLKFGRT
jgi:NhaA family Na+:H+ antiporter